MILTENKNQAIIHNVDKPRNFTVKEDHKLFSVLFDKLYSDKIAAVIRELSTNAYEIHQILKKEHVPFLVKLPSWLDTNFSIRDYGTGLTQQQVEDVYTKVFESTKDNSNELGGAFGLGSKSPMAYAHNFIVNSFVKGKKYVYFFVRGRDGCPSYTLAQTVDTTEPDGLEIVISANREDINAFRIKAQNIYKWFKHKPTVIGNQDYKHAEKESPLISGKDWEFYENNMTPVAICGNISYSLDNFPNACPMNMRGMVLYFNIGEISPAPSRETLSYDSATIKAIEDRYAIIEAELQREAEKKVQACTNFWEAALKACELCQQFDLKTINYNGINTLSKIDLSAKPLKKLVSKRSNFETVKEIYPYKTGVVPKFIVNDLKTGGITRSKTYRSSIHRNIICFYCEKEEKDDFKKALLLDDSQLIYTSSFPKPVYTRGSYGISHKTKAMKLTKADTRDTYCWSDVEIDLADGSGFYVEAFKNKIRYNRKHSQDDIHPYHVFDIFTQFGLTVYGVKLAHVSKLGSGWVNAFDHIKDFSVKYVTDNKILLDNSETYDAICGLDSRFKSNLDLFISKFSTKNELTEFKDYIKNISQKDSTKLNKLQSVIQFIDLAYDIKTLGGSPDKTKVAEIKKLISKYKLVDDYCSDPKELYYYCSYILEKGR